MRFSIDPGLFPRMQEGSLIPLMYPDSPFYSSSPQLAFIMVGHYVEMCSQNGALR